MLALAKEHLFSKCSGRKTRIGMGIFVAFAIIAYLLFAGFVAAIPFLLLLPLLCYLGFQLQAARSTTARLEQQLHDYQERYAQLTDNVTASIIFRNSTGSILYISPYTEILTGYPLPELSQGTEPLFDRLVLSADRERYQRAWQVSLLGEDIIVRYQLLHRRGFPLWVESHHVPLWDEKGDILSILSVTIDVTSSVHYQQNVEQQSQELGDFARMVSHDLKAPIFTIKGMATTLAEDYGSRLETDAHELVDYILSSASRLEQLVESILEYSTVSTKYLDEEDVCLEGVLTNVLGDLSELIKEKRAIVHLPNSFIPVRGEPLRIYQILSNIIGNALKYSAPERAPEILIRCNKAESGFVSIEVEDNGIGIPGDKLTDIFRPYYRGRHRNVEGNGIGLACVKKIVDRLGGSVSVTSTEGKGSIFTVSLPQGSVEKQTKTDAPMIERRF